MARVLTYSITVRGGRGAVDFQHYLVGLITFPPHIVIVSTLRLVAWLAWELNQQGYKIDSCSWTPAAARLRRTVLTSD